MRIPVFVSCPTRLSPAQDRARKRLARLLDEFNLEPRALGRSDFPAEFPLREVLAIARHCAGGIILGFEQFQTTAGTWKRGVRGKDGEKPVPAGKPVCFPTPWNHLEAGILFGLNLPLLIFREESISGGVFDAGVTDVYVHNMPPAVLSKDDKDSLKEVLLKWYGRVSARHFAT
jgi:hypothetical protein